MAGIYLILVFAFAFGIVVTDLGFAGYMVNMVSGFLSIHLVPLITFLLCCIISYATGSLSASAVIVVPLSLIHIRWNDEGKVLMLTFHRYPESYVPGQEDVTEFGQVWVTSLPEMEAWFAENYGDGKTPKEGWTARFEMLLGMPADGSHTHFSALWADPEDLTRPAYNPDAADSQVLVQLPEDVDEEYKQWFDENIIWSYFDSWYPWTRLGYTYDYADNGTEYGLSEFLVNQNSTVDVEFTYTVDEMVEYLKGIK